MRDAAQPMRATHEKSGRVDLDPCHFAVDAHEGVAGVNLRAAHPSDASHSPVGGAHLDPGHRAEAAHVTSAGVDLCAAQPIRGSQRAVGGAPPCLDHRSGDTQGKAVEAPSCSDHASPDDQGSSVAAPYDALLLILADAVDDLERVRIATDNRIRSLAQVKGLDDSPESKRLGTIRDGIAALEHSATLDLQRAMRAHPLGQWVKRTHGVGAKQAARLLAAIGDPAERENPAKLWQYCGHGDPARSHCRKGRPVEHSPLAKMRTRLIAESCMKQMASPYRAVYDRERAKWADRDTTDLHKHNHALRVVGKAMLLDLWREARNLRGDQDTAEPQVRSVPADLPLTNAQVTPKARASAAELAGATA